MMQAQLRCLLVGLLLLAGAGLGSTYGAPLLQIVTTNDVPAIPAETGGGDSHCPVFSPDGRYVLFASSANNLVAIGSNTLFTAQPPARLNVYLRDRVSGTTRLVSVNLSGGASGNGDSLPVGISTNGQYALFESNASDLVEGDTNKVTDIFVRDMASNQTVRVNVSTNDGFANGDTWQSAMTPDARYVTFASAANNLVPDDTNGIPDIFVRDLESGSTVLASPGARTGTSSDAPLITPNGRYVAFLSSATNLAPGVESRDEVYVRDLVAGMTYSVSTNAHAFLAGTIFSYNHAISDDGQYVAFEASPSPGSSGTFFRAHVATGLTEVISSNAVALPSAKTGFRRFHSLDMSADGRFVTFLAKGSNTNTSLVYLWDGQTSETVLVSQELSGATPTNGVCDYPVIDETGRFVAFLSTATNLTTNVVAEGFHLYVRDLQEGVTRLVDANSNGSGSAKDSLNAPRFADGARFIAFDCTDADLVPNDSNHAYDVFVRDLATNTTELISARDVGLPSQTLVGLGIDPLVSVSADGRLVAFATFPGTLLPDATNLFRTVFVRDLLNNSNLLVSADTNGLPSADGMCGSPAISADGRWVAFGSMADNLVGGDTNKAQDVFVRDLLGGTTALVSVSTNGVSPGNNASFAPQISTDGRYVLFRSRANNLASGPFVSFSDNLFLRDLQTSLTYAVSPYGVSCATMTPDGRFVAFGGADYALGGPSRNTLVWDSQLASLIYTNITPAISSVAISTDGKRIAGVVGSRVYLSDRSAGTNWLLVSSSLLTTISHASLQFSADGRFLVYTTAEPLVAGDTNAVADVYLYDFQNQTNLLVSRGSGSPVGNGPSDSPAISSDGRFVVWRSRASNLVPGDGNGVADVFLYDRESGGTLLLSVSAFGDWPGNDHSGAPLFSADGRTILFQSWAGDLVAQDFNQTGDPFAVKLLTSSPAVPFVAQILLPAPGQPKLTWPAVWGNSYRVQYKNDPQDGVWLDLNCSVTVVGDRAWATDLEAGSAQRFYRIVSY